MSRTISLLLVAVTAARAATYNAASCSVADVQAAISAELATPADGDIISIPAGSCPWTGTTVITATFTTSVTIQGAGAISATSGGAGTTGSDVTTILDHVTHNTGPGTSLSIGTTAGKTFRLTGIAFTTDGTSQAAGTGIVSIGGTGTSVRVDHNHWFMTIGVGIRFNGAVLGVMDHNYFDASDGLLNNDFAMHNGIAWQGDTGSFGDKSWTDTDHWGSSSFFFIEDNRFHNGDPSDASTGARYVFRYNTVTTDSYTGQMGVMFNHGLTPTRDRSMRALEAYNNTFTQPGSPGAGFSAISINGGTMLAWSNTITQYRHAFDLQVTRQNNGAYGFTATPNGWGYCGTAFNGTGSNWDQNSNASTGYACMDGVGRGAGDMLSSDNFPSTVNSRTGTIAWPQQARTPVYLWNNTYTPSSGYSGTSLVSNSDRATDDLDFYQDNASFTGTSGVGTGLLSARPSTCTAGPGGNTPGVGYWATDQSTLYVCSATNTWTSYYTPYTYPHPLVSGSVFSGSGISKSTLKGPSVIK